MKTYTLEVLTNPATGSNSCSYFGIDERSIRAASLRMEQGAYMFFDKNSELIASYPINRTIIKEVK